MKLKRGVDARPGAHAFPDANSPVWLEVWANELWGAIANCFEQFGFRRITRELQCGFPVDNRSIFSEFILAIAYRLQETLMFQIANVLLD